MADLVRDQSVLPLSLNAMAAFPEETWALGPLEETWDPPVALPNCLKGGMPVPSL